MMLSKLIRKWEFATATVATSATHTGAAGQTVATVATVAVANPTETNTPPMIGRERNAIRAWLDFIDETDPVTIDEILGKCENVLDARRYFLERSKEVPRAKNDTAC